MSVVDGQVFEREQAYGTIQGVEPNRGADKNVVPEQADQVEEAVGVQVENRSPARLLPTGAALRFLVCAALLLSGHDGRSAKLWLRGATRVYCARAAIGYGRGTRTDHVLQNRTPRIMILCGIYL